MIDSIKIILKDFSGDLKNCTFVEPKKLIKDIDEKEYHYDNYRLYNHSQSAKHFLKVCKKTNKVTKKVTVTLTGSLRKRAIIVLLCSICPNQRLFRP